MIPSQELLPTLSINLGFDRECEEGTAVFYAAQGGNCFLRLFSGALQMFENEGLLILFLSFFVISLLFFDVFYKEKTRYMSVQATMAMCVN